MHRRTFGLALVGLAASTAGCAVTIGKPFTIPDRSSFVLGQTTTSEIIAKCGQPTSRSVRHSLNATPQTSKTAQTAQEESSGFRPAPIPGNVEFLTYYYIRSDASKGMATTVIIGAGAAPTTHSKSMLLVFWDDRLTSYNFSSSFDGEGIQLDDGRVKSFVEGSATRSEIVWQLGLPTGESIYPSVAKQGTRALTYTSLSETSKGAMPGAEFVITRKTARFLFDPSDRLIERNFRTTFTS